MVVTSGRSNSNGSNLRPGVTGGVSKPRKKQGTLANALGPGSNTKKQARLVAMALGGDLKTQRSGPIVAKANYNLIKPLKKPIIKYPIKARRSLITETFGNAVQEYLINKNKYPVNFESRYEYIGRNLIRTNKNTLTTYTGGNFNKNGMLIVEGSARETVAENAKKTYVYDPEKIYNDIITPLIQTYATPDIKSKIDKCNYSLVLRSRKSTSNKIHWHTNARETPALGASIWQIIYYVDTPKTERNNGVYTNATEDQRGKLGFIISRATRGEPIVGELSPHAGIGIGVDPNYFYHKVLPPANGGIVTTRQIIVLSVYTHDGKLASDTLGKNLYTANGRNLLNRVFNESKNRITGPNKAPKKKYILRKFTQNTITRAFKNYIAKATQRNTIMTNGTTGNTNMPNVNNRHTKSNGRTTGNTNGNGNTIMTNVNNRNLLNLNVNSMEVEYY